MTSQVRALAILPKALRSTPSIFVPQARPALAQSGISRQELVKIQLETTKQYQNSDNCLIINAKHHKTIQ